MYDLHVRSSRWIWLVLLACAGGACRHRDDESAKPELAVVGESTRWRAGDPLPKTTPWFSGGKITLAGARGETLGIQVFHRTPAPVTLTVDGATVRGYAVKRTIVQRASTAMYGPSHGVGAYPDELIYTAAPSTDPAYFEITIGRAARPGIHAGMLRIRDLHVPVVLTVAPVTLPLPRLDVWAYFDQRELAWAAGGIFS